MARQSAARPAPLALDDVDAVFRGFADPTRIRILSLLAAGELCVCDLVEIVGLPQPTVSRHLAYLRRTGLVEVRHAAKFAHYRLATPANAVHQNLINCVRSCFLGIDSLDVERREAEQRIAARAVDDACAPPVVHRLERGTSTASRRFSPRTTSPRTTSPRLTSPRR